ncbi:transcriptional repressor [uncultured Paracoccus sp.]|uniref:transcriptional repressor n=1 Tax=uncultured Paracoccus sp. TaxID=189685 RepID=UPI002607001F|nr:transcriptional repressor [uncultured Paracoccus sp.]
MHDHDLCIAEAMARAQRRCRADGLHLTPVRRRVLEILLEEHRAMGAYEILDRLRAEGLGSQPPVAYRALDFLMKHGFVHRIETLNAFVACTERPGSADSHVPGFLICRTCRRVIETCVDTGGGRLETAAAGAGFAIEHAIREAAGRCADCRSAA